MTAAAQRRAYVPRNVNHRRTVAGQLTAPTSGTYRRRAILHWPQPALGGVSRAPEPGKEWPALLRTRAAWYASDAWRRDWPAEATAHRAAYDLMEERGAHASHY